MIQKTNSTTSVHHNEVKPARTGWVAPGMMADRLVVDKELVAMAKEDGGWYWTCYAPGVARYADTVVGAPEISVVYQCADGTRVAIPSFAMVGTAHYQFTDPHGGVVGVWMRELLIKTHTFRYHGEAKVFEVAA